MNLFAAKKLQEEEARNKWWWFFCNDNEKFVSREKTIKGSIWRAGRFFLKRGHGPVSDFFHADWSFFNRRDFFGLDLYFSISDERGITFHFISPGCYLSFGFGLPRWMWRKWIYSSREFGIKLGYIGDIAWIMLGFDDRANDMYSYYKNKSNHAQIAFTQAQIHPGWQIKLKWPPVLDWVFGRAEYESTNLVGPNPVMFQFDGKDYMATFKVEEHWKKRPRWPWRYRVWRGGWIDVPNPPRFAGKGENSWDCGDDGIWGTSTKELTSAGAIGDYIKAVLKNRDRYGMPSRRD